MAHKIIFDPKVHAWDLATKTFSISEKDVPFSIEYEIENSRTRQSESFTFTHSTGPEFDPNTKWIYKGSRGNTLQVCNDPQITQRAAEAYLQAKTGRN